MTNLLKRAGLTVLGVVVMLAWWSIRGSDGGGESLSHIPAKVWEGGGGTAEVTVETSGPARMYISFEKLDAEGNSTSQLLEAWEKVDAGSHSWTIDVPPLTYADVGITAENPQVGATLKLTVRVNGSVACEYSDTLTDALPANYAFGLGCEFEDIAKGTKSY